MAGQTEVMFNGGVPMLDGTWYNPKTGDAITVRDTLFEDNNLVIMTTDGRRIPYSQMQKYVKSDKPIPKMPKVDPNIKIKKKNIKDNKREEALAEPATWDDLILEEDKEILSSSNKNNILTTGLKSYSSQPKPVEQNVDDQILEKALKRWDDDLKITVNIEWGVKKSILENLMDMFGYTEDDFTKYLLKRSKNLSLEEPMKNAVKCLLN